MKKINEDVIKTLSSVSEVEKVVWAYSGFKRCSDFWIGDNKDAVLSILESLNLDYDGNFIKVKSWPSWKSFVKKYHKNDDYLFDLAAGLFYDIPYCCSKAYQIKNIESSNRFFSENPFKGKITLKEVFKLDLDDSSSFFNELRKHEETYGFKKNYGQVEEVKEKTVQLILSGKLPESTYLLLGQTYVPCKTDCPKFLAKSNKMLKSLTKQLGIETANHILEKYKKNVGRTEEMLQTK